MIRIGLYAKGFIKKGEELCFDYGLKGNVPWLIEYNKQFEKDINDLEDLNSDVKIDN